MSPYDPDSWFGEVALHQLEAAEIPVITSLAKVHKQLAAAIGAQYNGEEFTEILDKWVCCKTTCPPTWRSLYDVLRKLGHEELIEQIEQFLGCELQLHRLPSGMNQLILFQIQGL